jgi:hypothetical protein
VIVSAQAAVSSDETAVSATIATFARNLFLVFMLMCCLGFDVMIVVANLLGVI